MDSLRFCLSIFALRHPRLQVAIAATAQSDKAQTWVPDVGLNAEDDILCAQFSTDSEPWFQSYLETCTCNLGGIYNVWRAMKQMDEHFIPRLTAQAVIRAVSCWPPQKVLLVYLTTLDSVEGIVTLA
ncbi:hypothetical protein DFH06DRAFT_1122778 [Mycena polygramma]|nr:hypothetical protein DFH06DRAFT_1122778 [Mycena polygramma]